MEGTPQLNTAADLEMRAARVADPGIDLKTKLNVACELREMLDIIRESESARVIPHMVPVLLDILRSGEPAWHKDMPEFQFRRCLLDILHRLPSNDALKPQMDPIVQGMLHILRHDNEENGGIACKIMVDILRAYRTYNQRHFSEFIALAQDVYQNVPGLVEEHLSEGSAVMDTNTALPARRSLKIIAELAMVIVAYTQSFPNEVPHVLPDLQAISLQLLEVESPIQKKTREDYEAMGGIWAGMSPEIKNTSAFSDLMVAQVKTASYLAFVLRGPSPDEGGVSEEERIELRNKFGILIGASIRILQDCPATATTPRRDLLIVVRHLLTTIFKRDFAPYIDKILYEPVLWGTAVGCRETVKQVVFAIYGDFVTSLRNDMSAAQLTRLCHIFIRHLHDPRLVVPLHVLSAKIIFSTIDIILVKDTKQGAGRTLTSLLDACVDKLESIANVQAQLVSKAENPKGGEETSAEFSIIEKARPISGAMYAIEKPEETMHVYRQLVKLLMQGVRAVLHALKKCDGLVPDGIVVSRLFENSVRCLAFWDNEPREASEYMDWFGQVLGEVNLHVFQEVWTQKIDFFFDNVEKRPILMHLAQALFSREYSSPTLVAILLRFLVNRLPELGEYEDQTAAVCIRMFKMTFAAVAQHPQANEPILASHLGKLIMDSFPLAAKATKPTNYLHLLRLLFRAIGGGGGKFELLYKEVLPLLPEMLECLNRQLLASEGLIRDMIVELCLTVPLRLTHLLPYLSYLMKPLVLALRGNAELVSQGLRTLELCIDNLTPDFLDPTLNTVLRDLMEGLHSHLKPLPANHHLAHTTIRVLGKLGGRNRRLLDKDPLLNYSHYSETSKARISFGGAIQTIELGPTSSLAASAMSPSNSKSGPWYRQHAYDYLEVCLSLLLHEGVKSRDQQEVFVRCLEGLYDAIHVPEVQERAEKTFLEISQLVLSSEVRRAASIPAFSRKFPSQLLTCYLDALPHGVARENTSEAKKIQGIISKLIRDLIAMTDAPSVSAQDVIATLNQIANRFTALCLEDPWKRKCAGCSGIGIMTQMSGLGTKWVAERQIELVKTLLVVLKDMPYDLPRDVDAVLEVLVRIIRVGDAESRGDESVSGRNKQVHLIGILLAELASSSAIVRMASQKCIELLAELTGKSAVELLSPHRDRMLTGLYTKPLRALPFSIQIGMIEAVRYCISLQPPLPELNDELLRLLHETLALADADDVALIGRSNPRGSSLEIIKLRVACIRLLTAAMPLTDFFSKQHQTRQKVTGVYFKSLYSPIPEVKEVAHEGLRTVLAHQSRLPRELLQTGLRPILMNLADPKRLSIPGLEGLARLLELLTNYFKVEIGHKLLDHFRVVADPQMLQASSRLPLLENEGITKLVRLANIFHLLPSTANIFLENLVNAIVQTEAQMHFSGQSPFSEPLAKYLDRYPIDAVDFFMRHLHFPRHIRTLRSILQANLACNLLRELASRTSTIVATCFEGRDQTLILPGLLLCSDLATLVPGWLRDNDYVVNAILSLWDIEPSTLDQSGLPVGDITQRYSFMVEIFIKALEQSPRIDLLFNVVSIFSRKLPLDLVHISQFLYRHVAYNEDLIYRRNVLTRFMIWFQDRTVLWSHKRHFMQFVFTPTLLVHAVRSPTKLGLIDDSIVKKMHTHIWQPMTEDGTFAQSDDLFKIEILHFTTVMVHRYPEFLQDVKKDIIRCAWHYITSEDTVVKQTAYLLAARFFEAFEGPQKFHLRVWTGLLKPPHVDGKALIRQALDIISPVLLRSQTSDPGYPQWAKTTRRLLAEEGAGWQQVGLIYHLIVRQASLFYPVRALFIPHVVNNVPKLGLGPTATSDSKSLSVDILQVIFDWEQQAASERTERSSPVNSSASEGESIATSWVTPLPFRESIVSFLVRLATAPQDPHPRNSVVPRALSLLKLIVGPSGWSDVTFKLHYFSRALEQSELKGDAAVLSLSQALSAAKVLQVISAEKDESWFRTNAPILTKLVRKGLVSEDGPIQDCLHPVFDRLIHLYPLPKEDELQQTDLADFHAFIYSSIADNLRNVGENLRNAEEIRPGSAVVLRGVLLMLKSVVQLTAERIEPFSSPLMKVLSRLARDHIQTSPSASNFEAIVRMIMTILEISQIAVAYLGDQRKWLLSTLVALVDKSKSAVLCRYMLDIAREWAINKRDPYPTMKEKATLLQKMVTFEMRGERGEALFNNFLELIYDIYTDPSLRRTDLTSRLEQPFLLGCRAADPSIRERFIDLMDVSIPRSLFGRLTYILGVQSWEALADHNWLFLALHLLLGSIDADASIAPERKGSMEAALFSIPSAMDRASTLVRPMQRLLYLDSQAVHSTWISVFPAVWSCLSRREQVEVTQHMIVLLSKDYHFKQANMRPNVIQTLLTGIHACSPPISLPPHLVKYLAKTFGAWHVGAEILQSSLLQVRDDEAVIRDTVYDSLADVYAELAEDDMFYGLWRRRSKYHETNVALAFEQCGMWEQASSMYELAQSKTRAGALPFSEAEFCLWEDHWILAAQKLQQWDVLYDLARAEDNHELILESAWRYKDWSEQRELINIEEQISKLPPDVATPRKRVFESFAALLKGLANGMEKISGDFTRYLEDGMQISLSKWVALPSYLSAAHIPLLQHFQQFVELQEAVQIFGSLATTNIANLEKKSSDLKMVLQAWRERLPNVCDDISIWSDLVGWRKHVFNAINKVYVPLITGGNQAAAGAGSNAPTYGYRGYHETAWIINRFAHVARKHDLLDVCFNQLNQIYTLPNIEISEAFLKLREQARCHYQKPGDLQAGLEVINNTNLIYFQAHQKAEFYTLKGMFHAKFGRNEEANHAFGQAVQLEMSQAKAWAAWGKFNDHMFKDMPNEMSHAANAVSCYLQAAGLYKNRKSRPLLTRVLWLLSVDDGSLTISRAFDTYKGDAAFWYWITLIPQLCLSINQREVKQARYILLNLAKLYPQALFFHLRTTKEEMAYLRHQMNKVASRQAPTASTDDSPSQGHPSQTLRGGIDSGVIARSLSSASDPRTSDASSHGSRQPWEYADEVMQILKTAFPLLIASMESMVEQIGVRFRAMHEEEIYRLVCMLLQEGMQHYVLRMGADDEGQLPASTVSTLHRLLQNLSGSIRKEYEDDFLKSKPSLYDYIQRLQRWRDKYEGFLDARPRIQSLDILSHYLMEFQYGKFDDIEVPGQYTEDKDSNQSFVRILKFGSKYENCRSHGYCWKRFAIHGHDHSQTSFAVQLPSGKHCRREERVMQLFRTLNGVLIRKKESRKRNLHFHLPVAVPCSTNLRLLQNDSSYITLGDIYDQHCDNVGITREDPTLVIGEKVRTALKEFRQTMGRKAEKNEYLTLKKDLLDEVILKIVPEDVLTRYMIRTMDGPMELWRMRKQFALQLAAASFMTYIVCLTSRNPSRFHLSRSTGQIAMSELLPAGINSQVPVFASNDAVPFRLTPNIQHFLGPIVTEGILAVGIMAIGRCLTEPDYDLEQQLCLFARDEMMMWLQTRKGQMTYDVSFRSNVAAAIDGIVKRAEVLACKLEREQAWNTPVLQTVINLISSATNPLNLLKMTETFLPWF
ncbi:atypical/PIKK/TRRAP protein kinase [Laetiporus sulphureus 93-53]|uniref:Atypical/PIKK/TRRAP protein kinase n=1 Tax=Laetiporus sulphureus 93-53 TaxID=1314785 RepID=A0A165DRX2_9APHY|nr:atypical/PIKK/TRRAP protein kinase [Laetiporus sulphureus 93-53]KZT05505.1 atypical/PIKK/TRRAP protein kinase [Laetiporus sulphureus 93-53]